MTLTPERRQQLQEWAALPRWEQERLLYEAAAKRGETGETTATGPNPAVVIIGGVLMILGLIAIANVIPCAWVIAFPIIAGIVLSIASAGHGSIPTMTTPLSKGGDSQ